MPTTTAAIVDSLPASGYSQNMTGAEEQLLLESIRNGDDRGFETLVKEHTGKVISLAWRLVGNREEAEEPPCARPVTSIGLRLARAA